MNELRDQFDSPWKEILEIYFEDFVQFFFPQIHAEIDWSQSESVCDCGDGASEDEGDSE